MEELLFTIVVAIATVLLDPANSIAGTGIGIAGRQGFFGRLWPLFLGATVLVSGLTQVLFWGRWPGYQITAASVLAGYAICLGCALVFGAKVFNLTGYVPRT